LPSRRAGASLVAQDNIVCLFGGQEEDNKKMNDVWYFDTQTSSWSKVDPEEDSYNPAPRSGHSAVLHNGKMYIFGGLHKL